MRNTKDIDFRNFLFKKKKKKQLALLQFYIFIMKVVLKVFQNSSLTNVFKVPVNRTTIYLEILLLVKNQDPFERGV